MSNRKNIFKKLPSSSTSEADKGDRKNRLRYLQEQYLKKLQQKAFEKKILNEGLDTTSKRSSELLKRRSVSPEDEHLLKKSKEFEDSFNKKLESISLLIDEVDMDSENENENGNPKSFNFTGFDKSTDNDPRNPVDLTTLIEQTDASVNTLTVNQLNNIIVGGKKLQEGIKKARSEGALRLTFLDFTLNIDQDSSNIRLTDLTKARFYAVIHNKIHRLYKAAKISRKDGNFPYSTSPLIHNLVLDSKSALWDFRFLLGSGFQYQWREFCESSKDGKIFGTDIHIFFGWMCCA
jgi:hypothetical protein